MSSLFIRLNRYWRYQRERSSTWPLHPLSTPGATSPSWNSTSVLSGHMPPCTMGKTIDRVALIAYLDRPTLLLNSLRCTELLASEGTINFAVIEAHVRVSTFFQPARISV